MSKKNYDKVAMEEFMNLPTDYKEDWDILRQKTLHNGS